MATTKKNKRNESSVSSNAEKQENNILEPIKNTIRRISTKKSNSKKTSKKIPDNSPQSVSDTVNLANSNALSVTGNAQDSEIQQAKQAPAILFEEHNNAANSADSKQRGNSRKTEAPPDTFLEGHQIPEQASQPSPSLSDYPDTAPNHTQPIPASAQNWYLVTNHLNMAHIMTAGMVMGPAGFGGKHYNDVLTMCPGQIPLFSNQIPEQALKEATKERKDLCPCIASVNIADLHGEALVMSENKTWEKIQLPGQIQSDEIALLVRAPLPLKMISNVMFKSQEDQKHFEERAHSTSNVDLSLLPVTIQENLFMDTRKAPWPPPTQPQVIVSDVPPARGQAVGSILVMLYHFANGSDLGTATFRFACGENGAGYDAGIKNNSILAELPDWLETGKVRDNADIRARTFWGIVDALIEASLQGQPQHNSRDVVIAHLEQELESFSESQGHKSHLENLIKELRSTANLGSGTISELLKRHNGPISKALLLFFLRENADDLFEFFSNQLIKEDEIIYAAILFGARAHWLALPLSLRTPKELATYVIQRMAAVEQGVDGLSFGALPPRPQPLRELFQSRTPQWNKEQEEVALDVSRTQKWTECLKTEINLQPGQYQLEVDKNGIRILLQGDSPATTTRVIPEKFLRRIGSWPPVDEKVESKIRAKLKVK
jgi:hypothetical protein